MVHRVVLFIKVDDSESLLEENKNGKNKQNSLMVRIKNFIQHKF